MDASSPARVRHGGGRADRTRALALDAPPPSREGVPAPANPVRPARSSLAALLLATVVVALPACQGKYGDDPTPGGRPGSIVGQPAPPLSGKTIDGTDISLADLRGQVVLVNAWATWCKPCMTELPELAKLHRERAAEGFSILGVNVDKRQLLMKVRAEAQRFELGYPNLFDPETQALRPWNVVGYPTSILVGRDGTIRWRRDGMIHPDDPELAKQIDAALEQPAS